MAKLKKPKKKNNKLTLLVLFVVTFVVAMFLVSALFKNFSPPVDVNIGGEAAEETAEENEHFAELDSRLKWIQYEDTMGESMAKTEASALGNSVSETSKSEVSQNTEKKSAKKVEKTVKKQSPVLAEPPVMQYSFDEVPVPVRTPKTISKPPVPTVAEVQYRANSQSQTTSAQSAMTKVYIGYYPTMEQANIVRGRVSTAVTGYQPFVRRLGSQYVVQVGTFSDRGRAVSLKSELDGKGFSARLLTE